jgi:hypothetical protein
MPVLRRLGGPRHRSTSDRKPRSGGPIAFIHDGDEIIVDLNSNEINCTPLRDAATHAKRKAAWERVVADNGGVHPNCGEADTRLLHRARHMAVPATRGVACTQSRGLGARVASGGAVGLRAEKQASAGLTNVS